MVSRERYTLSLGTTDLVAPCFLRQRFVCDMWWGLFERRLPVCRHVVPCGERGPRLHGHTKAIGNQARRRRRLPTATAEAELLSRPGCKTVICVYDSVAIPLLQAS